MFKPSDVTVQDFKDYFTRDFIYATVWNDITTYNQGQIVFYNTTNTFYKCLNNDVTSVPTVALDWLALPGNQYILDSDIEKAFIEAQGFNYTIIPNDATARMVYLYVTANYLYGDVVANSGLSGAGLITSKHVDDVSLGYGISQIIQSSPIYSQWAQTYYGRKAITYMYPNALASQFRVVRGISNCC